MACVRPLLFALCALTLLPGGCGQPERSGKGPALWRIEKDGLSAHLFGTIHVLPPGVTWETSGIAAAAKRSDRLVLEVAGPDGDEAGALFARMGRSPGLPPITARVPVKEQAALRAMMARGSMDEAMLSGFESWAAAMLLSTVTQADLNLRGGSGVEPALAGRFRAAHKPIGGLETVADQYGAFDRLPERVQRNFLTQTVVEAKNARVQFDTMLGAWRHGDMDRIASEFAAEIAPQPELQGPLLTDRNRAWAARIATMTGKPFIAVGAGHLAGRDNVVALLKARGYKVTRVE